MNAEHDFDQNASTPVHPEVVEACRPFLTGFHANPSAAHPEGRRVRAAIDRARAAVAAAIGAEPREIRFTSGGTESNNWALFGSLEPLGPRRHVVVSAIEHRSVLAAAAELERRGFEVTRLAPDASGAVRVRDLEAALRPDTALVSVMTANNETGVVQPAAEIGRVCRERGIRYHADAVCTIGKLPVDVRRLGCDLLSLSSHKLYAPKGCGVLYVRDGVAIAPLVHGCGQELGSRGGTENALAIAGFARACELFAASSPHRARAVEALRDALWRGIEERFPHARRNGGGAALPNTLNVSFAGRAGADVQAELGRRGFAVSCGAAAGGGAPSHVLTAMGLGAERARESVRFSLGPGTGATSVEALLDALEEVFGRRPARAGSHA